VTREVGKSFQHFLALIAVRDESWPIELSAAALQMCRDSLHFNSELVGQHFHAESGVIDAIFSTLMVNRNRFINMGGTYVVKIDDAMAMRCMALKCMETMLEFQPALLEVHIDTLFSHLYRLVCEKWVEADTRKGKEGQFKETTLKWEMVLQSQSTIRQLLNHAPDFVLGRLLQLVKPLKTGISLGVKMPEGADADAGKAFDAVQSGCRTCIAINKAIEAAGDSSVSSEWTELFDAICKNEKLGPMINDLMAEKSIATF
jgi:hypothetical protein